VLAFAPLVVLIVFLGFSGVSRLVLPQDEAEALGGDAAGKDVPIVVIIFDELPTATLLDRSGRIDANRYPGFAGLARDSTWYPNATTVADFSVRAVPAIMTGKNPPGSLLPIAADQPHSIFTLLGDSYELEVSESITDICPDSLCGEDEHAARDPQGDRLSALYHDLKYVEGRLILPPAIAETLPNVSTTFGDFDLGGEERENKRAAAYARDLFEPPTAEELEAFAGRIPDGGRSLSLIHMEVPHEPFRYLPDGREYNESDLSNLNTDSSQRWAVGPAGIATVQQRHYIQTGFADSLVQATVAQMRENGIWREAMVVVTADHGIAFKDGVQRRIAGPDNLAAIANSPLFIKYPNQERGRIDRRHVRTVDIVPTIADRLGVEDIYETDGRPIGEDWREPPIELVNAQGDTVTGTVEEMVRDRQAIVERAAQRLGAGGLDRLGPLPWLVGTEVADLPVGTSAAGAAVGVRPDYRLRTSPNLPVASGAVAVPGQPERYEDVDLAAEPLPAFVTGELEGVEPNSLLAIAVNGRVAATTRAFLYKGKDRFGAVVPAASLRNGRNEVDFYLVTPAGALTPLGGN